MNNQANANGDSDIDLQRARDALFEAGAAMRTGGKQAAGAAGHYVQSHPLATVATAAVAGLLVGLLLARR